MAPKRHENGHYQSEKKLRGLSEKKFLLSSDIQSNTKNIRVIRPGPSRDVVVKVNFALVVAL